MILDTYWQADEDYEKGIFYHPGDTITYTFPDGTEKTYEVMALGELGYALSTQTYGLFTASMLIPEADYTAHISDSAMITVLHVPDESVAAVTDSLEDFTLNLHPDLKYVSRQTYLDQFDTFLTTFVVVGGALCFVLAFIGILNFFNSIITMILEQKQEFAMMEAVGMTGSQLMGMLRWEGILHTLLSVLFFRRIRKPGYVSSDFPGSLRDLVLHVPFYGSADPGVYSLPAADHLPDSGARIPPSLPGQHY